MKQLGIEHIAAYSPEARGRSERLFRTLQDRLPKELRLAGIKTLEAANGWFKDHYMAEHNRRFASPDKNLLTEAFGKKASQWPHTPLVPFHGVKLMRKERRDHRPVDGVKRHRSAFPFGQPTDLADGLKQA